MNEQSKIAAIARAVLYEGYVLYPYRKSSLKNSQPSMMGTLYPASDQSVQNGRERAELRTECLVQAGDDAAITAQLRFLQLTSIEAYESVEHEVVIEARLRDSFETVRRIFALDHGVRLTGELKMSAQRLGSGSIKVTLLARNTSAVEGGSQPDAVLYAFHSAHVVATVAQGWFLSLTDPPADVVDEAASCMNVGVWPVLVGERDNPATILASPIVLPDFPQIAPESPGDLHDSSEIDEILTLRILTMTDEEKASARSSGDRARTILDRTESLTRENLAQLHGAFRDPPLRWSAWDTGLGSSALTVQVGEQELAVGDRVTLHPRNRADILDSLLDGRSATIAAIAQDLEDRIHVAVVVDDDPGRDLGEQSKPGHRFFFSPEELEPVRGKASEAAR